MSIKCCYDERCRKYEYLTREEAIDLVARRVLTVASQMWPGVIFVTKDNCWVETMSIGCFVKGETWDWHIRGVLYYYGLERLTGEEAQRVIDLALAKSEQFDNKAKVLKLTFKKGKLWVKRFWIEYDVLYVGDAHGYKEYCLEPLMSSSDIVAYVILTSDGKPIPVVTEEIKKHIWQPTVCELAEMWYGARTC